MSKKLYAMPLDIRGAHITPRHAVNMVNLLLRDREDSAFSVTLQSACGFYGWKDLETASPPKPSGYNSLSDYDDPRWVVEVADFLMSWGAGLQQWVDEETERRAEYRDQLKKWDEAKREKDKKRKAAQLEKLKKSGATARAAELEADIEDLDAEEEGDE